MSPMEKAAELREYAAANGFMLDEKTKVSAESGARALEVLAELASAAKDIAWNVEGDPGDPEWTGRTKRFHAALTQAREVLR